MTYRKLVGHILSPDDAYRLGTQLKTFFFTMVPYVPTLGDTDSCLLHVPIVFGEQKYRFPGMIRLSVGIEPYGELEHNVLNALVNTVSPEREKRPVVETG